MNRPTRPSRLPLTRPQTSFDALEPRRLFSTAAELPAMALESIHPKLWQAASDVALGRPSQLARDGVVRFDAKGAAQVHVRAEDVHRAAKALDELGVRIDSASTEAGVVQAWLPAPLMDDALAIAGVSGLELPVYAIKNVTSAGDAVLNTDDVRANFAAQGFTGTGVKIGVISDGAVNRANVGAELPAVTVNPALPGNGNEGTAMLEIVHDLAPGAQLFFSGVATNVDMVNSINYLVAQGCDVIVDDLGFLGEHFFSDTSVANAAKNAVNAGVTYVTAAGNFGSEQHYQATYVQGLSAFGGGRLHRFGAAGQEVNAVTIPNGQRFRAFLQWSDPYGTSSNDYDLYLFNSNTFAQLDSGIAIQNGNDIPFEFVDWTNNTGSTMQAELWIVRKDGEATRELELFTIGNSALQWETNSDQIFGQQAVEEVMSVAAVSAASPSTIEPFSSRGGSTIYSNFSTQTKSVRQTLDGTATDGVQTRIGQLGFFSNPFFGTSAAAPHAAAIAALVRQANPSLTPAQVLQVMADTAIDLGTAGYDTTFGAGRYDALAAVYKAFTPATPDLPAASDTGSLNTDNITSLTNFSLTGVAPAGAFVELFVDGIFKGSTQLASGVTNWSITPAGGVANGNHIATVRMSSSNATLAANRSNFSAPLSFTVDTVKPTATLKQFQFDTPVQRLDYLFSEEVLVGLLHPGKLSLENITTGTTIPPISMVASPQSSSSTRFSFPGLPSGVLPDGNYVANLSDVRDPAGNLMNPDPLSFFFLQGDITRDRAVSLDDFTILAANFGQAGLVFSLGNINYSPDGAVNLDDFTILAAQFGKTLPAPADLPARFSSSTPIGALPARVEQGDVRSGGALWHEIDDLAAVKNA